MRAFYINDDIYLLLMNANTKAAYFSKSKPIAQTMLPERSLQYVEETCKLRDDQTFNAAVFTSQPQQVSHQRLHLWRQKHNFKGTTASCQVQHAYFGHFL